jgi:regulator of replication initiation timing
MSKIQLGPHPLDSFFSTLTAQDGQINYAEEAKMLNLDSMGRDELLRASNSFRVVIIVYSERLSNLSYRLNEKEQEIIRLKTENSELRKKISELEIPDFIPQEQKIQEWLKGRELGYKKQEADMENSKILAQGKVAVELGEVLKDNKYAPHAINSLLKKSSGIKTDSFKQPNLLLESRIKEAESLGFIWPTRGGKRPTREMTCIKLLTKWEQEYEIGKTIPLDSDPSQIVSEGHGAIASVINRIKEQLGPNIDLGDGKNAFNRLQRAIKLYRKMIPGITQTPLKTGLAVTLCEEIFGKDLDPEEKSKVVQIYSDRLKGIKEFSDIPPTLIRKACHLGRLPVFFQWEASHSSPHLRLKALKNGYYDSEYQKLINKIDVESKNRGVNPSE